MRLAIILSVLALSGCGADGEPVRPSYTATLSGGSSGVHLGGAVGLSKGPVSIGYGF
ncbi:hypothetical protein [Puniceibacterium sediminis]|uniref:Uncharacterized protein n=1 Tax=Puniceibacterium sediminis TaxID=1608407 RepID=A0A238VTZ6_9RHOB|nr:hypothetical protein [Puniceibacterium sediminis]SNR37624.1 hypothetical protein SAMN06265370_103146 [Puniceibacterium sediminis]